MRGCNATAAVAHSMGEKEEKGGGREREVAQGIALHPGGHTTPAALLDYAGIVVRAAARRPDHGMCRRIYENNISFCTREERERDRESAAMIDIYSSGGGRQRPGSIVKKTREARTFVIVLGRKSRHRR